MMIGFVSFVHIVICFLLVLVILMQSGRGAGLAEGFSSAESFFGARTSAFMVKTTTVLAGIFLITCLSLAFLSSQKGKSLMAGKTAAVAPVSPKPQEEKSVMATPQAPAPAAETVVSEALTTQAQVNQDSPKGP